MAGIEVGVEAAPAKYYRLRLICGGRSRDAGQSCAQFPHSTDLGIVIMGRCPSKMTHFWTLCAAVWLNNYSRIRQDLNVLRDRYGTGTWVVLEHRLESELRPESNQTFSV